MPVCHECPGLTQIVQLATRAVRVWIRVFEHTEPTTPLTPLPAQSGRNDNGHEWAWIDFTPQEVVEYIRQDRSLSECRGGFQKARGHQLICQRVGPHGENDVCHAAPDDVTRSRKSRIKPLRETGKSAGGLLLHAVH